MRKHLRRKAKYLMSTDGVTKINRCMSFGRWRRIIDAYPDFYGKKRQYKGSSQPILHY